MSRELRFRAWDSGRGVMLVNHTFASIAETRLDKWEGLVWEQFTGLQDKNGVDIYECDKVRCTQFDDDEYTKEFEVRFGEGGFSSNHHSYIGFYCVDSKGDEDDMGDMIFNGKHDREIEVIGNIHEVKS